MPTDLDIKESLNAIYDILANTTVPSSMDRKPALNAILNVIETNADSPSIALQNTGVDVAPIRNKLNFIGAILVDNPSNLRTDITIPIETQTTIKNKLGTPFNSTFYKKDDFWNGYGDMTVSVATGTLATNTISTGNAPAFFNTGTYTISTGTSTTGQAGRRCEITDWHVFPSLKTLKIRFSINTLSNLTDRYSLRLGFLNGLSTTISNGIYIRYDDSVNSGKFEFVTTLSSSETVIDTGVTAVANTDYVLTITLNSNNTIATCSINGSTPVQSTTNLVSARGSGTGYGVVVTKSTGTNSRLLSFDYFEMIIA